MNNHIETLTVIAAKYARRIKALEDYPKSDASQPPINLSKNKLEAITAAIAALTAMQWNPEETFDAKPMQFLLFYLSGQVRTMRWVPSLRVWKIENDDGELGKTDWLFVPKPPLI